MADLPRHLRAFWRLSPTCECACDGAGGFPSPEEVDLGLIDARPAWELLEHRREFVSIHSINTKKEAAEKPSGLQELQEREISNDPMDPVQEDLPEPEFVWDVQHDYSDHSDRWDARMSLRRCATVMCVMGSW